MLLYRIDARGEKKDGEGWNERYCKASESIFKECGKSAYIAVCSDEEFKTQLVAIIECDREGKWNTPERLLDMFNEKSGRKLLLKDVEEIPEYKACELLSKAYSELAIDDDDDVVGWFEIARRKSGNECVADKMDAKEIELTAKKTLYDKSLFPELERIRAMKKSECSVFHPVHYIIRSDDVTDGDKVINSLINVLYENKRLRSKRYQSLSLGNYIDLCDVRNTMHNLSGCTVVLDFTGGHDGGEGYAYDEDYLYCVRRIAGRVNMSERNLLVVAVIGTKDNAVADILKEYCRTPFVEIEPENAVGAVAKRYLEYKAMEAGATCDEKLFEDIREDRAMTRFELRTKFAAWHTNYLIEKEYPLYTGLEYKKTVKLEEVCGKAMADLEEMVGLNAAKTVIGSAVDYYKVQKLYQSFGKKSKKANMHMVFTGNPGSAKTTVARLFFRILKDNGVIKDGDLVEVGRADLVGKYVGSTAPKVKEAFERAKGGVLFIDEAYSLVDDRDNLYGDEAINTIVQEMENNRDDTIVIFAGYSDKMEAFLERNPGLRSRIAFHVPFEDYRVEELMDIARLFAKRGENVFSEGCEEKLLEMFEIATKEKDFGNGRFVRNVMEHAEMARASRLAKMELSKIGERDLDTFLPEDFKAQYTKKTESKTKQQIGF
ncbi:MAG: AAA family ATPase [Clostridia bacterium]|nr:AAA family ATPase [Clostridia bacterium]